MCLAVLVIFQLPSLIVQVRYINYSKKLIIIIIIILAFPPPTITYTNGSMDGCVNITINHPYITDNVAVQYIINFTCKSNGITNETKENNITTNGITETICYDTFNNFECDGEYTVIVNIFRSVI